MAVLENGLLKRMAYVVGVFMAGMLNAEMTFSDLQSAIANAADGDVVYVENDMEYTGLLVDGLGKRITLASPEGQTNTLTRAASYGGGAFMKITGDADNVTIRDLVIDGNKAEGRQSARFIDITAGALTLESGAELRNVWQSSEGSIRVMKTGHLVMNEGAVIRAFVNSAWGTAVMVGEKSSDGVFTMNGGLITECASTRSGGESPAAYGGAVYVYGGTFRFYGGSITGNTGANACAGIAVYAGKGEYGLHLRGTASATNNVGEVINDIGYWGDGGASGYLCFDGPWTGRATVYAPRVVTGGDKWVGLVRPHEGFDQSTDFMPGLGNLSVQDHEEWVANGYSRNFWDDWFSVYFSEQTARVGGRVVTATLQEALDVLGTNDVVELFRDVSLTVGLVPTNGQKVVLRSVSGAQSPYVISRAIPRWESMFTVSNHASIVFEDVIIDGRAGEPTDLDGRPTMVNIGAAGSVTLGKGAVLRNSIANEQCPAVYVGGSGSSFVMEEGSVIRNFRTPSEKAFATAIRVGNNTEYDVPPVFTMNGGMISNCVSGTTGTAGGGYGGAVYVQNAVFYMNDGTITGNSALGGGCGGVMIYTGGKAHFSGTATVTNNPSPSPDVFSTGENRLFMRGTFRGSVGVSSGVDKSTGEQKYDSWVGIICEEGATGAWNFFSAATDPYAKYIGYMWDNNRKVYFGTANGWVDGKGVDCRYENAVNFTPTAIDADGETLPHTFGGRACKAGGAVDVTFDEAAARAAGRTVIPLVAARDGDVLTGSWSFTVPTAGKGVWKVKPVSSADGVTAYNLVWCPPGGVIVIR